MTTVSEMGERAVIKRVMKHLTSMPGMPLPFWDDASALSLGDGRALVINTDMLVWETDIPQGMTPFQAGRKTVVMNVSDLGAKGVKPLAFMPNIAVPADYPVDDVVEMSKGFEAGARAYDSYVVGGDTNEACDVIIAGSAIGIVEEKYLMKRAGGVEPGDTLAVTGLFGLTSVGFTYLLNGIKPSQEVEQAALESIYMPEARVDEGLALAETRAITSCMDSSDGLSVSLYDLRRSSGYGFVVDSVPVHPLAMRYAENNHLDPIDLAFNGGEEYELVFTYQPEDESRVREALNSVGCSLVKIGVVTEDEDILHRTATGLVPIKKGGWNHFT